MKHLPTSCLRLLSITALVALPLSACKNEEGQARNEAQQKLAAAAEQVQTISLQSSYPTPMTEEQAAALTDLAQSVPSGGKPEWMTEDQERSLANLSGPHRPIETHKSGLEKVQSTLAGGSGGLSDQQAAQAALRSDAALGLARVRLEEAERSDEKLAREISLAGAHIDAILELRAIAAANAAYDPAAPLRTIDSQAQDARTRLARYQADVRDLQKRIGDLQDRIDAEVRESNRLNETAATKRESARTAPLDRRIALTEEAASIARQADAHQVAAARLEAEVDVLQPELVRAQMRVLEAEGELKDLDAARARIKTRQDQVAEEGRRLDADLRAALDAFAEVYGPLASRFEEELMPRYEAAREAADSAIREARAAGPAGGRVPGAQQALGQVLWRQAMSTEQFAQLIRRVAENGPALGRSGQDSAAADSLDARAKEARAAAAAILQEALSAVEGSGRSEAERAGNEQLAGLIRKSLEYITGEAVAEVRDLSDLGEITPMPEDVPVVNVGEGPVSALRRLKAILDGGNLSDLADLLHARSPGQQAALDAMRRTIAAQARLDAAARSAFGVGLFQIMRDPKFAESMRSYGSGNPLIAQMLDNPDAFTAGLPDLPPNLDLDSVEFMYDNSRTTAWVDDVRGLEGWNFVQVGAEWLIEMPAAPEGSEQVMNLLLDPMISAFESVARRTEAGEFSNQWLMVSALIDEVVRALTEAIGKGGLPGVPPGGTPPRGGGGN